MRKTTAKKKTARAASNGSKRTPSSVAEGLLATWPPLNEVQREALRSVIADAECERLGAQTKSRDVFAEAESFARVIDRGLREHPFELRRYGAPRFVWFLECVVGLGEAIALQRLSVSSPAGRARAIERATLRAREVHADLALALQVVASVNEEAEKKRAPLAVVSEVGELPEKLCGLAALADELGRSYDARTRALVGSVALHADDAQAARVAAASLEAALSAKDRPATEVDLPATNRVEGRVLGEMRFAMEAFIRARSRGNKRIPALTPGRKLRAILEASAGAS